MNLKRIPILPLMLLAAMVLAAYWVYENVEWYDQTVPFGQKKIARNNPFLAAERLLETQKFSVNKISGRRELKQFDSDDTTGLLWLSDIEQIETTREAKQLISWIHAGGHLLVGFSHYPNTRNPSAGLEMLHDVGVFIDYNAIENNTEIAQWSSPELKNISLANHKSNASDTVQISQRIQPFLLSDQNSAQQDEPLSNRSRHLMQIGLGNGYLTTYTEFNMFDNRTIDKADHAYVLLWIAKATRKSSVTLVSLLEQTPGLLTTLWRKLPLVLIILTSALLLQLWRTSRRLGPVEQQQVLNKNNLMAHLEARGRFHYKHKHKAKLLQSVQHAAILKFANLSRGVSIEDLEEHEQNRFAKQVSERLGCTPSVAKSALFGTYRNDDELILHSRILQKILHK